MGMVPSVVRQPVAARAFPRAVADPGRAGVAPGLHDPRAPARGGGGRAPGPALDVPEPPDERRPADVLLPVRRDDGTVLRDSVVPVGRARSLGDRHRPAYHAAFRDDA